MVVRLGTIMENAHVIDAINKERIYGQPLPGVKRESRREDSTKHRKMKTAGRCLGAMLEEF